ncbi:MAG: PEP-CTERM sorting domain-containing protein [Cyanobacteria bacterium J06638_28]
MSNFRSLLLTGSVATGLLLVGADASEAAGLKGALSLAGDVEFDTFGGGITIDFDTDDGISDVVAPTDDFATLAPPTGAIADLTFLALGGGSFESGASVIPFIDFGVQTLGGVTDTLTFNLVAPIEATGISFPGLQALFSNEPFEGEFVFGSTTTAARGLLTAQEASSSSSYSISITTEPIPEPLTILGSGAALAMGAFLKRRHDAVTN